MNKSKFEKYNTPFQRLLRNMFADSIKDEWKTNEERDLFDKFFFLLGAAEQYEVEEEMTEIGRARVGKECRSRWSPYH